MRADLEIIQEWIPAGSRVLDLGCGNGELLTWLRDNKQVTGYGLENDADNIAECVAKGINVIEQDLDKGLGNFASNSFDIVVMTQALQAVHYPDKILDEMLRVGRQCIITFPNFGHWRCRWYLASKGRMPVSEFLPYTWYNTPNIHFCTFADFEALCREREAKVIDRLAVDQQHRHGWASKLWPNLLGEIGIYRVSSPTCRPQGRGLNQHISRRTIMGRLALLLLTACLSVTAMAADAIKGERQEKFGDVTVHYNTFNSTFLTPDIAKAAQLTRSKNQGVINISVLKDGKPQMAQVSGTVKDLTSQSVPLDFRQITEQGAIYYIAQYPVPQQETRTFEIKVQTGDKINTINFNQELFPGE